MHRYFNIACEIENIVDNALARCFQFGDSPRAIRRVLEHAIYLQQELSFHKDALLRCEVHSLSVDRSVDHCQQIFREYCTLLDDIASTRSPRSLLDRLALDIADFRNRLDTAHASLSQAIDDFEEGPPRRPLLPRSISYQDYDILDRREQSSSIAVIASTNGGRRRSDTLFRPLGSNPVYSFEDFDLPRIRRPMINRREYRYSEVIEEQGLDWPDDVRISGYRHVRRLD